MPKDGAVTVMCWCSCGIGRPYADTPLIHPRLEGLIPEAFGRLKGHPVTAFLSYKTHLELVGANSVAYSYAWHRKP